MRKIEGFQCDNCKHIHSTEEKALECEAHHKTRLDGAKITYMSFESIEGKYGLNREFYRQIPRKVHIRFSEQSGDFATFIFDHHGFKGV